MLGFRLACLSAIFLFNLSSAYAATKTIISDATYIMGDGESPSFAEGMVLQKAKQAALEEAGTYVQSYTKTINEDLTADEIQTIAGGVIQVEVIEKTRSLIQEGLRLYVKIEATVTTDRMEELARRIKGTHIAEEYKKLQEEYASLTREVEALKQGATKAPTARERAAALDQIQERERDFASLQGDETALVRRLVSGEALVQSALNQRLLMEQLINTLGERGYELHLGEVTSHPLYDGTDQVELRIPATLKVPSTLIESISEIVRKLRGNIEPVSILAVKEKRFSDIFANARSGPKSDPDVISLRGFIVDIASESEPSKYLFSKTSRILPDIEIAFDGREPISCPPFNPANFLAHSSFIFPVEEFWLVKASDVRQRLGLSGKCEVATCRGDKLVSLSKQNLLDFTGLSDRRNIANESYRGGIYRDNQLFAEQFSLFPSPGKLLIVEGQEDYEIRITMPERQAKAVRRIEGHSNLIADHKLSSETNCKLFIDISKKRMLFRADRSTAKTQQPRDKPSSRWQDAPIVEENPPAPFGK